jgi:hypothetical protein
LEEQENGFGLDFFSRNIHFPLLYESFQDREKEDEH